MKVNKFTLGVASGLGVIALAIPVLAQISSAQSSSSTSNAKTMPTLTVQCVQAMAALENQQIATMDSDEASRKAAMQAHANALTAAASITDDTARQAAIKTANQNLKTAMDMLMKAQQTAMQTAEQAVQTACGKRGGMGMGGFGGKFEMQMPGGGEMKGRMHGHRMGGWKKGPQNETSSTSSATAASSESSVPKK